MSDKVPDRNTAQIAYWNNEAGPRWVAMQERMDAMLAPLMHAALDRAHPVAGENVLDVGCGCGATLLELSHRVGPNGSVLGVDISAPMLGRARERVQDKSPQNVHLTLSDAATYAFAPGAFDLAFSRFGVMFFDEPVGAFANIRSALAAAGRLTFICWAPLRDNPWFVVPLAAARPYTPPQPEIDPNAPGPFAFADPDRVRTILVGPDIPPSTLRGMTSACGSAARAGSSRRLASPSRAARLRAPWQVPSRTRARLPSKPLPQNSTGLKVPAV